MSVDQMRQAVQQHVTKIHEKVASQYRSKFGTQVYEVGDKVWVRNSKVRTRSNKLDPLWCGPCEVLEQYANTVATGSPYPKAPMMSIWRT